MAWRKWIVLGFALGAAVLAVLVRENAPGLPPCILQSTTGLFCPGCGVTRASRALMLGDLAGAMRMNAVAILLMPLLAIMMTREIAAWAWQKPEWRAKTGGRWGIGLGIAVILFGILRNLPGFEFLRPGGT